MTDEALQSPQPPKAPYGMTPGQRHFLPGITPLLSAPYQSTVKPDVINLDEEPAQPTQQPEDATNGWDMIGPDGKHIGTLALDPEKTKDYQGFQVQKLGNSLLSQATNDGEKQAAQRALQWGLAAVGTGNIEEIKKDMVHRYDIDTKGSESLELAKMRHPGARGAGGPAGPTKADKFADQTNKADAEYEEKIVGNAETNAKLAAINEAETDLDKLDGLMASGQGLQQRVAQAGLLKDLTGKVSVASERLAVQGGAGYWNALRDKISQYTSDNPSLTAAYVQEFRKYIATARAALKAKKQDLGKAAGERLISSERFVGSDEATKKRLRRYGYGTITGEWPTEETPPQQLAAPPSHLQQFYKK